MQGSSGKLDELNSILQSTQKKLNTKFKVSLQVLLTKSMFYQMCF